MGRLSELLTHERFASVGGIVTEERRSTDCQKSSVGLEPWQPRRREDKASGETGGI